MENKENKYIFGWQEKSSALVGIGPHKAFSENTKEIFAPQVREHFVFWKNGQSHTYFSEKSIARWKEEGKKFGEKGYLRKFLNETASIRQEFGEFIKKIENKDIGTVSNRELLEDFNEYYLKLQRIQALYMASQPEGVDFVNTKLSELLRKELQKEDIEEEHKIITSSSKLDLIQQERVDFSRIKEKDNESEVAIKKHAKKYPCFFFNTYKWESILLYLQQRKKQMTTEESKKEIENIYAQKKNMEKKKQELLFTLSNDVKEYATILMELGHDRLELKNCWSGAELLALDLFQEIQKRIGLSLEDFFATYTEEDIESALLTGKKLSEEEIRKRKQAMLYKINNGTVTFKSGEEAEKEIKQLLGTQDFSEQSEVKGMVANSGIISGRVRIVLIEDIEKFQKALNEFEEGEILITTMTSPNMVPLIKKAAGIITNEGGICSHAAIIAREVTTPRKKPCIVGTKDATRIFKTGEYVLMNKESGKVKRITKEEHEKMKNKLQEQLEVGGN